MAQTVSFNWASNILDGVNDFARDEEVYVVVIQ